MQTARRIHITGIVQGVGFRPFVYNLAVRHGLAGWVLNAQDGVHIEAQGEEETVTAFLEALPREAPPMSRIEHIEADTIPCETDRDTSTVPPIFEIHLSDSATAASTLVSPDIATCPDCVAELMDPSDRRYHYPFINCTQCGPRFTIIEGLPYDRPKTSMKGFPMCPSCDAEYHDPADRRFHAQPDACFDCGPHLRWVEGDHEEVAHGRGESDALIERAARYLSSGRILAIKGLGGFHLACDATDAEAVAALRERKHRPVKPFACMVPSLRSARELCRVDEAEEALLTGPFRPIVLLRREAGGPDLAGVADGLDELGIMLPYTPVQHLLLAACDRPLVMTSGNLSEEPILSLDDEAREFLLPMADALLGNDRPICSRYDDSVVRVVDGTTVFVRRARGYAPVPVKLPERLDVPGTMLACGPEQKNTFCLTRGTDAFVSQHLGDLENELTYRVWEQTVALYERLFDLHPDRLVADLHPEYLSTKWAREREREGTPLQLVQHHHAHIAAVTGEHGYAGRVIGIALDGTGLGDDGTIWGGEVLLADWRGYERVGHLRCLPLPGGAAAVRNPCRMAWAALLSCGLQDHPGAELLRSTMTGDEMGTVATMVSHGLNCPPTSSAGRLLDAVSALLGVCPRATYDGEPAIFLEAVAHRADPDEARTRVYRMDVAADGTIDPTPALSGALDDLSCACSPEVIAWRFHESLAHAIVEMSVASARTSGCDTAALGGGVFMNRLLLDGIRQGLQSNDITVLVGRELPPNDGCLSYGQAVIALARNAS